MADYGASDSARAVDTYYAEALFGDGQYARAGAEYVRSAYGYPGGHEQGGRQRPSSGRRRTRSWRTTRRSTRTQDRSGTAGLVVLGRSTQYAEHYPHTDVAKRALIEEGRRASEAGRWDVMASAFRQYAAQYPQRPVHADGGEAGG